MESEPDCKGKWIFLLILSRSAINVIKSLGKSFGCGDVKLNKVDGNSIDKLSSNSVNLMPEPSRKVYSSLNPTEFM